MLHSCLGCRKGLKTYCQTGKHFSNYTLKTHSPWQCVDVWLEWQLDTHFLLSWQPPVIGRNLWQNIISIILIVIIVLCSWPSSIIWYICITYILIITFSLYEHCKHIIHNIYKISMILYLIGILRNSRGSRWRNMKCKHQNATFFHLLMW